MLMSATNTLQSKIFRYSPHFLRFTPAGWAFSIWGLIFAFLAVYTVYQALPKWRLNEGFLSSIGVRLFDTLLIIIRYQ